MYKYNNGYYVSSNVLEKTKELCDQSMNLADGEIWWNISKIACSPDLRHNRRDCQHMVHGLLTWPKGGTWPAHLAYRWYMACSPDLQMVHGLLTWPTDGTWPAHLTYRWYTACSPDPWRRWFPVPRHTSRDCQHMVNVRTPGLQMVHGLLTWPTDGAWPAHLTHGDDDSPSHSTPGETVNIW